MKANVITALKKVVKEMVEKEVAKQINIVVSEITNPTVTSETDAADHYTGPAPETRHLAKDPILNKILNETQGGISNSPVSMPSISQEMTGEPAIANEKIQVPDFMQKAMSGHSAKVVKEIENKHGTKS